MFDLICIFTKGGVVVWSKFFCSAGLDLVNILIKNVLMEEKTAMNQFIYQNYIFKWRLENQSGLVFAVIYQEVLQLMYVDDFIEMVRDDYMSKAYPQISFRDGFLETLPEYEKEANEVLQKWQELRGNNDNSPQMRTFGDTKRGQKVVGDQRKREEKDKKTLAKKKKKAEEERRAEEARRAEEERQREEAERKAEEQTKTEEDLEKEKMESRKKLAERMARGKKPTKAAKVPEEKSSSSPKKYVKEARGWGYTNKITKKDMETLDHSKKATNAESQVEAPMADYFGKDKEMEQFKSDNESVDLSADEEDEIRSSKEEIKKPGSPKKDGASKKEGLFSRLTNSIKSLTGNKMMTEIDLLPVLKDFRDNLVQKNVATEIADKVCESVKTSLLTQKTATFTSVKSTVKDALKGAIQRVLTPKVNIDILKEAQNAKARGVPYTVVFIGVNGVGKSTSLAKVAYYLKTKGGLNVLIAACDNFRAGAVEQLQTHGRCLGIPVFQRGYGDDAAQICKEAVHEAKAKKYDVVLIDTAGRMQDNEPLMKALAKLINVNNPDVILFVGEALVGNDAIDQLTKFNKSLVDFGLSQNPRTIDGIVLTKFDTVDEKVGAALSMVYTTGKPIVFVGVGQKYPHLAKLNVNTVVHALMS